MPTTQVGATQNGAAYGAGSNPPVSIAVSVPGGVADGDLLVAFGWAFESSGLNVPSGWTQLTSAGSVSNRWSFAGWTTYLQYRVAASEPGSYTWTASTGTTTLGIGWGGQVVMTAWRGRSPLGQVFETGVGLATGTNETSPLSATISCTSPGRVFCVAGLSNSNGDNLIGLPSGMTTLFHGNTSQANSPECDGYVGTSEGTMGSITESVTQSNLHDLEMIILAQLTDPFPILSD